MWERWHSAAHENAKTTTMVAICTHFRPIKPEPELLPTQVTTNPKMLSSLPLAAYFVCSALAAPFVLDKRADSVFTFDLAWDRSFEIHKSCNASQTNQLEQAFDEVKVLAQHAKDHILAYGNLSDFYQKYFGAAPTYEVIGVFESVLTANKTGVLFRCDNIDGNCRFKEWAGHWRGSNATDETVICDYSYTSRLYLSQMCTRGYTVSGSPNTRYWASDLLHRIWHTDKMGEGIVGHYADTYDECLELAEHNASLTTRNSATLRYYALDVYAYDIAVPGVGCTEVEEEEDVSSSSSSAAPTETATETTAETATTTETAEKNCHTHSDGEVHCE